MKSFRLLYIVILLIAGMPARSGENNPTKDTTVTFKVFGVCGQCKQRIEKSLKIKGVGTASWNVESKMLTVSYAPSIVTLDRLHETVAAVGHDTEKKKASDETYKALPECCHYRDMATEAELHAADSIANPNMIRGIVVQNMNGQTFTLAGASIQWLGGTHGTISNAHGEFMLEKHGTTDKLVVSYTGLKTDTVSVKDMNDIQIALNSKENLAGVVVTARTRSSFIDAYSPFRTGIITRKELVKAACCNLSESFETNPSVDVSYNDAATGSKQIQLLGLAGIYTQLTVENLPGPRGLATPLGLSSIAGPWVESIQLIKGTGSVINGFESIAGQINVELRKPQTSEKLYLNGYLNTMGKTDMNLNWAKKINSKWSTGLLLHDDFLYTKQDVNNDGFRDLPTGNQFSGVYRWQYLGDNGLISHFGVKFMTDRKTGGQLSYDPSSDKFSGTVYGLGINTQRYEVFGKLGYVFPEKIYKSVGLQLSSFQHKQDSYFGQTTYNANQGNFYANLIYQSRIGSDVHTFKTGLSFLYDHYNEMLNTARFARTEAVPGAFAEYSYAPNEKWDVVAGIRADHNSLYGWFATPRLNIRYAPTPKTTFRFSVGRGQRTANIIAENMGVLVSARTFLLKETEPGKAYGLNPEIAWNKGISFDQKFKLFQREATLGIDFYRNDFRDQVIVDLENVREVSFYNLDGKSYSNSFQAELNLVPVKKLDVRIAYRYFDVKSTYNKLLLEKPFVARNRAFVNLAYEVQGWKFDYTFNAVGRKRIPSTSPNPPAYTLPGYSPSYITMNAQVSKTIGRKKDLDMYVGGENLTNYFQQRSILAADQPFSEFFDASMVWGPVAGRLLYVGFRYTVK